jgi:ABC-type bacteriocin/lantibiotic exporter with double-glycine peptidase domain
MKDITIIFIVLLLIVVSFYAFQLLVLGLVGLVIYWTLPFIKKINKKAQKWK